MNGYIKHIYAVCTCSRKDRAVSKGKPRCLNIRNGTQVPFSGTARSNGSTPVFAIQCLRKRIQPTAHTKKRHMRSTLARPAANGRTNAPKYAASMLKTPGSCFNANALTDVQFHPLPESFRPTDRAGEAFRMFKTILHPCRTCAEAEEPNVSQEADGDVTL